ncbi:response regulator transcription factor [Bifidobacterium breve]|uniref:response regulator transcription factor n=1 Tax=Bifidobacterium breve TaxID=1685 RepID=UPI000CA12E13|nr:response regulator transcription factor [Bifidobacterium breve]AUE05906.1 Two-component response regulator [Bifidobacterium breve]AUE21329.1 Two-component response regulator [Bifidobacterium breve]
MTNIMLVDDLQYARLGYKLMLGKASDIVIVAQAGDGRQAIAEIERLESAGGPLPDVVLMDVRMPVMDGITATREITRRWPAIHVLILTTYDEDDYAYGGLDAGASGFLLKDASAAAVKDAIHAVANGDAVVTPRITRQILEHGMPRPTAGREQQKLRDSFAALPPRQREICTLIAEGMTNEEIARKLVLEPATIRRTISRILFTLQLHDRTQIAVSWLKSHASQQAMSMVRTRRYVSSSADNPLQTH